MAEDPTVNKAQVERLYSDRAKSYDQSTWHASLADRLVELCVARLLTAGPALGAGEKYRILDIATGTGMAAFSMMASLGPERADVVGVDLSPGMVQEASKKADLAGLTSSVRFVHADCSDLIAADFEPNTYDAVLCSSAIFWFPQIVTTLSTWRRVLKPRGVLAFSAVGRDEFSLLRRLRAAAGTRGLTYPNILEPLGTPNRCRDVLGLAGFGNVEVTMEASPYYADPARQFAGWRGGVMSLVNSPVDEGVMDAVREDFMRGLVDVPRREDGQYLTEGDILYVVASTGA